MGKTSYILNPIGKKQEIEKQIKIKKSLYHTRKMMNKNTKNKETDTLSRFSITDDSEEEHKNIPHNLKATKYAYINNN
jgi:hypothetical protein